jgi:hypothetical protein
MFCYYNPFRGVNFFTCQQWAPFCTEFDYQAEVSIGTSNTLSGLLAKIRMSIAYLSGIGVTVSVRGGHYWVPSFWQRWTVDTNGFAKVKRSFLHYFRFLMQIGMRYSE